MSSLSFPSDWQEDPDRKRRNGISVTFDLEVVPRKAAHLILLRG